MTNKFPTSQFYSFYIATNYAKNSTATQRTESYTWEPALFSIKIVQLNVFFFIQKQVQPVHRYIDNFRR